MKSKSLLFLSLLICANSLFAQTPLNQIRNKIALYFRTSNNKTISAGNTREVFSDIVDNIDTLKRVVYGRKSAIMAGATVNDNTDDYAALQAYINSNKEIYLPAGTYLTSQSLNVPSDRIIYGDGSATIIKPIANNVKVLNVYNSTTPIKNVVIQSLKIDGGGQTSSITSGIRAAYGIYVSNASNVYITNVFIDKCGVMNPSNPISDNGYGGYGILIESRGGPINNIRVSRATVTNIAGGGYYTGDGIYVAGYSSTLSNVPENVLISDCYVENVGRHCYTIAGEGAESKGANTVFIGCKGKNAALSGLDIEEGDYCAFLNGEFQNCGNYTGYYNPQTLYGSNYRLCAAIATGNQSSYNRLQNVRIRDSYYGLTWGAGSNNTWDGIVITNSTVADAALGLARFGEEQTIRNCQFLTTSKPMSPFYNMQVRCNILVENCIFASQLTIAGQWSSTFKNNIFKEKVMFSGGANDLKNITFESCTFTGTRGLSFENINTFAEDFNVSNCKFVGQGVNYYYGIYLVFQSVIRLNVTGCVFRDYQGIVSSDGAGIYHNNTEAQNSLGLISGNNFINCDYGIYLYQGGRYAKYIGNTFSNITKWCIYVREITTTLAFKGVDITDNTADNTCVNGLWIESPTGSWDFVTIRGNKFQDVTTTPYLINESVNNSNGDMYLPYYVTPTLTRTTGFTLSLTDAGKYIKINSASAVNVVVPNESTVPFRIGTVITIEQSGAGQATFSSTVQLNSNGGRFRTNGTRAVVRLIKIDFDSWTLEGNTTTTVL